MSQELSLYRVDFKYATEVDGVSDDSWMGDTANVVAKDGQEAFEKIVSAKVGEEWDEYGENDEPTGKKERVSAVRIESLEQLSRVDVI